MDDIVGTSYLLIGENTIHKDHAITSLFQDPLYLMSNCVGLSGSWISRIFEGHAASSVVSDFTSVAGGIT